MGGKKKTPTWAAGSSSTELADQTYLPCQHVSLFISGWSFVPRFFSTPDKEIQRVWTVSSYPQEKNIDLSSLKWFFTFLFFFFILCYWRCSCTCCHHHARARGQTLMMFTHIFSWELISKELGPVILLDKISVTQKLFLNCWFFFLFNDDWTKVKMEIARTCLVGTGK